MKSGVYYWQAGDQLAYILYGRMVDVLSASSEGVRIFTRRKPRSAVAKMKTLVYLGDL